MDTVICVHCGMARDRGAVPGRCNVCAPLPEQAREAQRLAEEAHFRIDAAIRRAAGDDDDDEEPVPTATSVPGSRSRGPHAQRTDVRWLIGPDPRTIAHLFGQGRPPSCCGKVAHSHRMRIAPPGLRGCRKCAYAAGYTYSLAERVTT